MPRLKPKRVDPQKLIDFDASSRDARIRESAAAAWRTFNPDGQWSVDPGVSSRLQPIVRFGTPFQEAYEPLPEPLDEPEGWYDSLRYPPVLSMGRIGRPNQQGSMVLVGGPLDRHVISGSEYRDCRAMGQTFRMRYATYSRPSVRWVDGSFPPSDTGVETVTCYYEVALWYVGNRAAEWRGRYVSSIQESNTPTTNGAG